MSLLNGGQDALSSLSSTTLKSIVSTTAKSIASTTAKAAGRASVSSTTAKSAVTTAKAGASVISTTAKSLLNSGLSGISTPTVALTTAAANLGKLIPSSTELIPSAKFGNLGAGNLGDLNAGNLTDLANAGIGNATDLAQQGLDIAQAGLGNLTDFANQLLSPVLNFGWDDVVPKHDPVTTAAVSTAYTGILGAGLMGNAMVLLGMMAQPEMRKGTNIFLLNLALADLLLMVLCVPANFFQTIFSPWIFGSSMCNVVAYTQSISLFLSAFSLVAISVDTLIKAMRDQEDNGLTTKQILLTIGGLWILAPLVSIPQAINTALVGNETEKTAECTDQWEDPEAGQIYFVVANLICQYILPLVCIVVSYVMIWRNKKKQQNKANHPSGRDSDTESTSGQGSSGKMLGVVTMTFFVSMLPHFIAETQSKLSGEGGEEGEEGEAENNMQQIVEMVANLLESGKSSVNPIFYAIFDGNFREMFKSVIPFELPFLESKADKNENGQANGKSKVKNGAKNGARDTERNGGSIPMENRSKRR